MSMPTLFVSHGSPMHAIDAGGAGSAWRAIAESMPRPRAVLIASAHWETTLPMLTGRDRVADDSRLQRLPGGAVPLALRRPGFAGCCAQQAATLLRDAGLSPSINGAAASTTAPGCRCSGCIRSATCRSCRSRSNRRSARPITSRWGVRSSR